MTKVLGHKQVKFVFVPTKLKGRLVVPWKCLGDEETKVCVSFLELVSYVSPYVMCSVIASFLAAAIAGKAQQQHGGVSPASEQARQTRQTDRPGERAKPSSIAHHPVGSNVFQVEDGEEESSIVVVVVVVVCFLVFCLSMFFLGVFWKLSLAHFFFPNFLCVFCCFVVEIITNIALYSGGLNCV